MSRVKPGLRAFTVVGADGTRRQYSWLYLAPLLVLPGLLAAVLALQSEIVVRNYVSKARQDPALIGSAIKTFAHVQAKTLADAVFALPEPLSSELPTLRLFVPTNSLNAMQHALLTGDPELNHDPGGDKPYFRAYLVDEHGETKKGRVCMRGAGKWHHMPEKPSLRFKIRKADITHGVRYLELSRPEDVLGLKNWLPNRIGADHLGLFDDASRHVRLFVNDRYFGVYLQTMRPGESLALRNGRMPGTFFKGDFRDDLWTTLEGWRFEGEASPADREHFSRFLETLAADPSPATLEALGGLVDRDVYARWAALMIVSASVHTDLEHNHTYFLCSNQGLLEALPWDVNGFGMHVDHQVPVDLILHPLMDRLTRDPRWVHLRNRYLHELLEGPCGAEALERLVDGALGRMRQDLEADVNLNSIEYMEPGLEVLPWSVLDIDHKRDELLDFARRRRAFGRAYLDDARVSVAADPDDPQASRVVVSGAAAVRVTTAAGEVPPVDGDPAAPGLLYGGLSEALSDYTGFAYERAFTGRYHGAQPAPLTYRVAAPADALRFHHALTGAAVTPTAAPAASSARTVHPSGFRAPATADVVLGPGELSLREDLHTDVGQRLVIRAGTTIRLGAGVGIYPRGQTRIEGTAAAPVKLVPLDPEPWACLGVAGAATSGTRFEHLEAWGGSLGTNGSVRFKGMISVYDCPEVTLRGCRFGANLLSDDAVNLGECDQILVEDCEWREARSDALDLDMCGGVVRDSRWIDSGNDGLDMMTCRLLVERCTFEGSGDKGISVGEGTRVLVRDCAITACHIGLEAKDACRALVQRTTFSGCRVTVNAYQKKWLYPGGGQAVLADCTLEGSGVIDLSAKRRSRISLLRTEAATVDRIKGLRVLEALPDEYVELEAELAGGA